MNPVDRIAELLQSGRTFCLATVLGSRDADAPPGTKVLIHPDGAVEGSLGSAGRDRQLLGLAREVIDRRKRRTVEAGGLRVFLDILEPEPRLLLCGAGHISLSLARFGREVGFSVTVLDDRPDFAVSSRFPGCEVLAADFVSALRSMPLGGSSYVVVITRGHEHDTECLMEVLRKETAYVGLIGSRRRIRFVRELLAREGVPQDRLDRLFTPIGLPLGAESPQEIALSIASELVSVRRRGAGETRRFRSGEGGVA